MGTWTYNTPCDHWSSFFGVSSVADKKKKGKMLALQTVDYWP